MRPTLICQAAFKFTISDEPIPAELQQQYDKLALQQRLEALRVHFRWNVQDPVRDPEPLAVVQPATPATVQHTALSAQEFRHKPHDRQLPPLPPMPNDDTREERARKAQAREAFRRWTGWLSYRDKSRSRGRGNGDGGGWLGN